MRSEAQKRLDAVDAEQVQGRAEAVLLLLQRSLVVVEEEGRLRVRLEVLDHGLTGLSADEIEAVGARLRGLNQAIEEGSVELVPGCSTLRFHRPAEAVEALCPGLFSQSAIARLRTGGMPAFYATLGGQWLPPGVTLTLTPKETDDLVALLTLGGVAAVEAWLATAGVGSPLLAPLATALIGAAAIIKTCQALSAKNAVGFKFTLLPLPLVVPYPA